MKKILMFMLVLGILSLGLVMAQDATSPTITTGVEATAAFNAIASHTDATVDSKFLPTTLSNPYGLSATGFVVAPWLTADWGDLVVNVSVTADSLDFNEDDSIGQATLNIKKSNLFGYSGFALVAQVKQYNDNAITSTNTFGSDDNYFGFMFESDVVTAEVDWESFSDLFISGTKFKRADITFSDDNLEARVEVKNGVGTATQITENTYFKYNNLFGIWTMDVAGAGKTMRLSTEATGSGLGEFDHDNFYYWDSDETETWAAGLYNASTKMLSGSVTGDSYGSDAAFDVLNTFAVMDGLSVKVGTVVPTADTKIIDWLRGDNLFLGAEYTMDGLGTFNAGFAPVMDYDLDTVTTDGTFAYSGSRNYYSRFASLDALIVAQATVTSGSMSTLFTTGSYTWNAVANKYKYYSLDGINDGASFWLDADLSPMMDALTLAVSVDGQFGNYLNMTKWAADVAAGMDGSTANPYKPVFENESRFNFGFNAEYAVSDALSVTADATVSVLTGVDYKKFTGSANTWDQDNPSVNTATDFYTSNYNETNSFMAYVLGDAQNYDGSIENPLAFNIGAKYTLSDMLAFSFSNEYTALAGSLDFINSKTTSSGDNFSSANAKTMHGFYGQNDIGLGAVVTPKENMTISVDVAYSLFLGLPGTSDLYVAGLTAAQKNVVDVDYAEWIDTNFNPWSASVTYKYSY